MTANMTMPGDIPDLVLGCGGTHPGIVNLVLKDRQAIDAAFVSLPASVYAVDLEPSRRLAACGTRAGLVYLIPLADGLREQLPPETVRLLQGRPVLSLCFTSEGRLVSADETGQVLCWDPGSDSPALRWRQGGSPICAVSAPSDAWVAGLSVEGQVLFWDVQHGRPVSQLAGPPPVSPSALARLIPWQVGDCLLLAYPACDGRLVVVHTNPPAVHECAAHEGRWFGALSMDGVLVTVGHDDAVARVWHWTENGPQCGRVISACSGVIAIQAVARSEPLQAVAVFGDGTATAVTLTPDALEATVPIPGEDFRVVAIPGEFLRCRRESQERGRRATELRGAISMAIQTGEPIDPPDAFDQLEALGCQSESLVLRASQAQRTGDELAELAVLHRLAVERSESHSELGSAWLERYLHLLRQFGQLELALQTAEGIGRRHFEVRDDATMEDLRRAVGAQRAGRTVVHALGNPADRLEKVWEASRILGFSLSGTWELHRSGPVILADVALRAEQLVEALRATGAQTVGPDIQATCEPVLWVHDMLTEEIDVVLIQPIVQPEGPPLRIGLHLAWCPAGTELTRSILVDAGMDLPALAARLQNEAARQTRLAPVNEWIRTTLRRIQSTAIARGLQPLGDPS
jgi:hypothetical protein